MHTDFGEFGDRCRGVAFIVPMTRVRYAGAAGEEGRSVGLPGREYYILNELLINALDLTALPPADCVRVESDVEVIIEHDFGLLQINELIENADLTREKPLQDYSRKIKVFPALVLLSPAREFCVLMVSFSRLADQVLIVQSGDGIFEFEIDPQK